MQVVSIGGCAFVGHNLCEDCEEAKCFQIAIGQENNKEIKAFYITICCTDEEDAMDIGDSDDVDKGTINSDEDIW